MDAISDFVNNISEYEIIFPLWFKVGIIVVILMGFVVGGYLMRDTFDTSYLRNGFTWFIFIGILNLTTILIIYLYYNNKTQSLQGLPGVKGRKGKRGKVGKSVSCSYTCKDNLYIKTVKNTNEIVNLNTNYYQSMDTRETIKYFIDQTEKRENINYTSFINNIILAKSHSTDNLNIINKFRSLLHSDKIFIALIDTINKQFNTVSRNSYGNFRSVVNKIGYLPIGDVAYGGTENYNLNCFVVSGDIMYPSSYIKLVSFSIFNGDTEQNEIYTIWRPQSQFIHNVDNVNNADNVVNGNTETENDLNRLDGGKMYLGLGDICRYGNVSPLLSDYAIINNKCLEPVNIRDLQMLFMCDGIQETTSFQNTKSKNNINAKVNTNIDLSYLITDNTDTDTDTDTDTNIDNFQQSANINAFSIWRTPMNTFITNSNRDNVFTNNTIYMNLFNNIEDVLNEYGNIKAEYKKYVRDLLQSIQIPQIITAMIYVSHSEIENYKELAYYSNRYQSQIPEFRNKSISKMPLSEILTLIDTTEKDYTEWNEELIRKASINIQKGGIEYNTKLERHLPEKLIVVYNNVLNSLDSLPVMIENTYNLLDIVNYIMPNGLDGRIAVDSNGIAEGGIIMNRVQEMVLRVCKVLVPPVEKAYIIKDECLGTFQIDKDRENSIKTLTEKKTIYNKYIDEIASNPEQYRGQIITIRQIEELAQRKIGELVGHIPDYMNKLHSMNMDDFATSRINSIINIYIDVNLQLKKITEK
jgi:hypothetical protein